VAVGVVGSFSGAQASSEGGVPEVMQAWASNVNAAGGVLGHPVEVVVADDAGVASQSVTAVKRLVEQDKVVAILSDQTGNDTSWASYVQGRGVPVIGGTPLNGPFLTSRDFYPIGTNLIAALYGVGSLARHNGDKIALLYCAESPQCAQVKGLMQLATQAAGVKLVVSSAVSGSAADYTAVCQSVASSGAESMWSASGAATQLRVAAACSTQGVKAKLLDNGGLNSTVLGKPGSGGLTALSDTAPWFDDSVPATKAYQDAVAKYAPGLGDLNGPNAICGWVSGKLFEAAVRASGSKDITPASVRAGLLKLRGETLGGLTQALTFSADKPTLLNCWFETRVVSGKWTEPNGLTPGLRTGAGHQRNRSQTRRVMGEF
jgi:branched-chain amino acid transport system substrate-binding protein